MTSVVVTVTILGFITSFYYLVPSHNFSCCHRANRVAITVRGVAMAIKSRRRSARDAILIGRPARARPPHCSYNTSSRRICHTRGGLDARFCFRLVLRLYLDVRLDAIGGCFRQAPTGNPTPPPSVWPHLFPGAGHEKSRGEQLKWSVAFRLYIGSFPCAQLPGPVHTARLGRVFFCLFSLGLCSVCSFVFLFVCMSPFVCFPEQLSHLPYSFWR